MFSSSRLTSQFSSSNSLAHNANRPPFVSCTPRATNFAGSHFGSSRNLAPGFASSRLNMDTTFVSTAACPPSALPTSTPQYFARDMVDPDYKPNPLAYGLHESAFDRALFDQYKSAVDEMLCKINRRPAEEPQNDEGETFADLN